MPKINHSNILQNLDIKQNPALTFIIEFYKTENECCEKAKKIATVLTNNKNALADFKDIDKLIENYNNLSINVFNDVEVAEDKMQSIETWINQLAEVSASEPFRKRFEGLKQTAVFTNNYQTPLYTKFNSDTNIKDEDKYVLKENFQAPALRLTRMQLLLEELQKKICSNSLMLKLLIQNIKYMLDTVNLTIALNSNQQPFVAKRDNSAKESNQRKRKLSDDETTKKESETAKKQKPEELLEIYHNLTFTTSEAKVIEPKTKEEKKLLNLLFNDEMNVKEIHDTLAKITIKYTEQLKLLESEFKKIQSLKKPDIVSSLEKTFSQQENSLIAKLQTVYLEIVKSAFKEANEKDMKALLKYLDDHYPQIGISNPFKGEKLLKFSSQNTVFWGNKAPDIKLQEIREAYCKSLDDNSLPNSLEEFKQSSV